MDQDFKVDANEVAKSNPKVNLENLRRAQRELKELEARGYQRPGYQLPPLEDHRSIPTTVVSRRVFDRQS